MLQEKYVFISVNNCSSKIVHRAQSFRVAESKISFDFAAPLVTSVYRKVKQPRLRALGLVTLDFCPRRNYKVLQLLDSLESPRVPCDLRLRRSFQIAKLCVGILRLCDLAAFLRVALTARWSTKLGPLGVLRSRKPPRRRGL